MNDMNVLGAMQDALYYVLISVSLVTIPILIVGLLFSVIQAATQINEMTLTFIPKFITMFVMLLAISPWMIQKLVHFTEHYMNNLQQYIR
jgi:flagellar biosynthetic protein FliQ